MEDNITIRAALEKTVKALEISRTKLIEFNEECKAQYVNDSSLISHISSVEATLTEARAALERAQVEDELRKAVATVLEGWTLPDAVRKILETAYWAHPQASEPVGINGLTEAETSATMSVMGLSKPKKPTSYERKCFNDWKNP